MAKKKKVKIRKKNPEELESFEQSLRDLETVVSELEGGNLTLSDSLSKYEEGIRNLKICHQILESAETKIRMLTGVDKDGNPITQDFDESASELYDRSSKRTVKSSDVEDDFGFDEDESDEDDIVDDSGSLF